MGVVSRSEPSQLQPVRVKDSVISAQHLTKKFGDETAVEDVSFDVPRASIFGFIGPSGSGKMTTIRLLTGVYTPTEGQATVLDRSPARFSQGDRMRLGDYQAPDAAAIDRQCNMIVKRCHAHDRLPNLFICASRRAIEVQHGRLIQLHKDVGLEFCRAGQ